MSMCFVLFQRNVLIKSRDM